MNFFYNPYIGRRSKSVSQPEDDPEIENEVVASPTSADPSQPEQEEEPEQEPEQEEEQVEQEAEPEPEPEPPAVATPVKGRRGRPPGSKNKVNIHDSSSITRSTRRSTPLSSRPSSRKSGTPTPLSDANNSKMNDDDDEDNPKSEDKEESGEETKEKSDAENNEESNDLPLDEPSIPSPSVHTPGRRGRKGNRWGARGKPKNGSSHSSITHTDPQGNAYVVENDEIVLPSNPKGDAKVDAFGHLKGNREYRVRTFTVKGRGDRLYMLSTEPARCMGFRDSYLLFQKHKRLHKIIATEEEKYDLIKRQIIPHSYKGRAIGIVTARSVFREFGAKIIVGGKRIIDDYDEEESRQLGYKEGEIADPSDRLPPPGTPYNKNQYVAWHGASSVYHTQSAYAPMNTRESTSSYKESYAKRKKIVVTDENWMYEHANAASIYNHEIYERRKRVCTYNSENQSISGLYNGYTGLQFFPAATQPKEHILLEQKIILIMRR